eukprot:COSAG06_NODE_54989_length_292_cov_0.357513_1_plen_48_part_01
MSGSTDDASTPRDPRAAADARLSAFFERSTRETTGEKKLLLARVALGR